MTNRRAGTERRFYTLGTLKNCTFAPRRMKGRRFVDRRFAVLDIFDSGVVALAIALVLLSITDSVFTLTLIARGGTEVNPVMNALLQHSVWAFSGFKMFLTAVAAIILTATGNLKMFGQCRARSILGAFVGLYLGLIIYEIALLIQSSPVSVH